jgi:hypothetical protein
MREELVLKVAILAEKFAPSVQWYVDIALELLERAGDNVSDDIWHRVVQLVTNNENMQVSRRGVGDGGVPELLHGLLLSWWLCARH